LVLQFWRRVPYNPFNVAEEILANEFEAADFTNERDRDLGFGSVVAEESRQRFLNRNGSFNVKRTGLAVATSLNLYHYLLSMSWTAFLALVLLLFFMSNLFFGSLYAILGPQALIDTSGSPFANLFLTGFFFSVQTFATIGYGTIHPVGVVTNLLVTIESYYSLLANALITGLVFARFARPTARIVLSDIAVIAPYRDITAFMFRIVNGRNNQLIEVKAQVMIARFVNEDGRILRKFDILELERRSVTFFPLTWTVVHPIDENSPLFGMTERDFETSDAEFLILLSATDETFAATVHQRSSYKPDEVRYGYKFVSIYNDLKAGEPISIDVRKLSEVEKVWQMHTHADKSLTSPANLLNT
jgi:inward rectifier potassium channel